jgi:hypothetical protein
VQIVLYALRLIFERLIWHVAHTVQTLIQVPIEGSEQSIEIFLCRTLGCNQLKGLPQCLIGGQTADQNFGNLAPCNDAVAGVSCLASIALQEEKICSSALL